MAELRNIIIQVTQNVLSQFYYFFLDNRYFCLRAVYLKVNLEALYVLIQLCCSESSP